MAIKLKDVVKKSGFKEGKSYSPEEIWDAGGTSAFGKKAGQDNSKIIEALKSVPDIEPFSEDEWEETMKHLKESQ